MSKAPNTRKGKVARLPYEVREEVNAMIRDGATALDLNAYLKTAGIAEKINAQNWTNWRQGGYQDWLQEQKRIDTIRKKHETIRRELEAGGFSVLDKAIFDVATNLADSDLDPIKVAGAVASLKTAVVGSKRAETYERRADLAEKALRLQESKFERDTCELFLKWYANEEATRIAASKEESTVKVDQLRQLIFGRPPDADPAD